MSSPKVVLELEEFQEMISLITALKEANSALNEQIRVYNLYATQHNERSE